MMKTLMQSKVLTEPLLHFVLLAGLIFIVLPKEEAENENEIVVSSLFVKGLAEENRMKAGPDLTKEDLIAGFVRDEALFREGRSLGLSQDDAIVRRRVVQKMELLIRDSVDVAEPTDQSIKDYRTGHPSASVRVSFEHAYFSPDKRESAGSDASLSLKNEANWSELPGDPFPTGSQVIGKTRKQVSAKFGEGFATELSKLKVGKFEGPIKSAVGVHLVRVNKRERVLMDEQKVRLMLLEQARAKRSELAIQKLVKQYTVRQVAE